MLHEVKIQSEYFEHIKEGKKTFEVRKNDRDYQVGDELLLCEYRGDNGYDKLDNMRVKIVYIHTGLGMKDKYVVLGIMKHKEE